MSQSVDQKLTSLRLVADKLETQNLDLDEAIELYAQGMKLAASIDADLKSVEMRIEVLMQDGSVGKLEAPKR